MMRFSESHKSITYCIFNKDGEVLCRAKTPDQEIYFSEDFDKAYKMYKGLAEFLLDTPNFEDCTIKTI